jgi:hypothetical protein
MLTVIFAQHPVLIRRLIEKTNEATQQQNDQAWLIDENVNIYEASKVLEKKIR